MVSETSIRNGSLLSGQKVLGYKVENPRGESLGRIEDIVIGAEGGQIACVVLSFGGVLSLGNKRFAFPWSALQVDSARKKVILNLDRKTLAMARGFDKDHWPEVNDWNGSVPPPSPPASAPPERVAIGARGEAQPQEAPPPLVGPAIENEASAKNRMEHWGKSWQSHGLDRS